MQKQLRTVALSAAGVVLAASPALAQIQGPSSSQTPYLVPVAAGVQVKSILTVGDGATHADGLQNGVPSASYRMAGIPDGLGSMNNGDGTFDLFMNHEIGPNASIVRDHGSIGSFVSRWTIDSSTLQVLDGDDQIKNRQVWDEGTASFKTATPITNPAGPFDTDGGAANRYCAADLPAVTAFFNPSSGLGTQERIFTNGEETRPPFSAYHGRAFAHVVTGAENGTSYEFARMGNAAWENVVASPFAQDRTVVIGLDDSDRNTNPPPGNPAPSEIYMYVGNKQATGSTVERAGLTNGSLFGLQITGTALPTPQESQLNGFDPSTFTPTATFAFHNLGDVSSDADGVTLQNDSAANDVFRFQRIEDGVWDPTDPNVFWFVTTDQYDRVADGSGTQVGRSRLFKMTFDDIVNPENGGTIDIVLDGATESPEANPFQTFGPQMMDNITAVSASDGVTRLVLQEDPGGNAHNAKIWVYDTSNGKLTLALQHDPARFGNRVAGVNTAATLPFTNDEESSGIIPAFDTLGNGWFLTTVQAHGNTAGFDSELVERGQLLAVYIPQAIPEPGTALLLGAGLVGLHVAGRRSRA